MRRPVINLLTLCTIGILPPLVAAHTVNLQGFAAPGTTVEDVITTGLISPEGPVWDTAGNIYFSDHRSFDTTNAIIYKVPLSAKTATVFKPGLSVVCGQVIDAQRRLYYGEKNKLSRLQLPSVTPTILVQFTGADTGYIVNDLTLTSNGGIFFTYNSWARPSGVYYLPPSGPVSKVFTYPGNQTAGFPNGIEYIEERGILYVAISQPGKVRKYHVDNQMKVTATTDSAFASISGPDGIAIDAQYNVWVANNAGGISVYDSTGTKKGSITMNAGGATNCCFGGSDFQTLYITSGTGVFSIRLLVKGRPTTGPLPVGTMHQRRSDAVQPLQRHTAGASVKIGRPGESGTIAVTPKAHARRVLLSGAATR